MKLVRLVTSSTTSLVELPEDLGRFVPFVGELGGSISLYDLYGKRVRISCDLLTSKLQNQ